MVEKLSDQHVLQRYIADAVRNWGQTEQEALAEYNYWFFSVLDEKFQRGYNSALRHVILSTEERLEENS